MCGEIMIQIEKLTVRLGEFNIRDINLRIGEGEYVVILGPTGAGKSVLLECIAGICIPDSGTVRLRGRDVTRYNPEKRNIGYVPQDYALFPNMTVRQNIGYGLKTRKIPASDIQANVSAMMEQLGITHLEKRLPLKLSGGEKQRAALGRALITEPDILLLDEPLSALDENLRSQLAGELRRIQQRLNRSFLHVCHNFDEAAMVADRIAIMRQGSIEQTGTISEILTKPSSLFIAEFTRTLNFHQGTAETVPGGCRIKTAAGQIIHSAETSAVGPVTFGIRPEELFLTNDDNGSSGVNNLTARVARVLFRPSSLEVELDAGFPLIACHPRNGEFYRKVGEGDVLRVFFRPEAVMVFPGCRGGAG